MLKHQLLVQLAKKFDISIAKSKILLQNVIEMIVDGIVSDGVVVIRGLGTFKVYNRKEREGTKPGTAERRRYPASKTAAFKASKSLKERLNKTNT